MKNYKGSCHCGNVKFSFKHEEIKTGLRCNCSLCIRRGAIMTDFVIPPEDLIIEIKEKGSLGLYEFDNKVAHHFFCKKCGIYPFHQTFRMPDQYRVNLACIESIDTNALEVGLFDGRSL